MAARIWSYIRQHESHRDLLIRAKVNTRRPAETGLDAIIVPASRPADNLDQAAALAHAAGCRLVVLCSLDARAAEVAKRLDAQGVTGAVVVDIPAGYKHDLLAFETSNLAGYELPKGVANPNGDLSVKRNLGLLLARMVGWKRIFFMDDDIRDLALADLTATVSMLDRPRITVAGMQVEDYPDNSVVCHARRETGDRQDVFVSGSCLAIDCTNYVSFFPEVYNEDWFFFYDAVRERRVGCLQRTAKQLYYDPFRNPRRARHQEFGDVLAEGLYALIHKEAGNGEATRDYWANFIAARRKLIDKIKKHPALLSSPDRGKMLSSLESAMACLMKIQPRVCEAYIRTWRRDLKSWQHRLARVSAASSVKDALRDLGLQQFEHTGARRTGLVAIPAAPPRDVRQTALANEWLPVVLKATMRPGRVLRRKTAAREPAR